MGAGLRGLAGAAGLVAGAAGLVAGAAGLVAGAAGLVAGARAWWPARRASWGSRPRAWQRSGRQPLAAWQWPAASSSAASSDGDVSVVAPVVVAPGAVAPGVVFGLAAPAASCRCFFSFGVMPLLGAVRLERIRSRARRQIRQRHRREDEHQPRGRRRLSASSRSCPLQSRRTRCQSSTTPEGRAMACLLLTALQAVKARCRHGRGLRGGSSSGTVFGGSGAGNFLKKLTVGAAVVFVFTSMSLAYLASSSGSMRSSRTAPSRGINAELKKQRHEAAGAGSPKTTPGATAAGCDDDGCDDETSPSDDAAEDDAAGTAKPPAAAAPSLPSPRPRPQEARRAGHQSRRAATKPAAPATKPAAPATKPPRRPPSPPRR